MTERDQNTESPACGQSGSTVLLAVSLLWIARRVINPLILWLYDWKCEVVIAHGRRFEAWVDPIDKRRYSQQRAMERCEERIVTANV